MTRTRRWAAAAFRLLAGMTMTMTTLAMAQGPPADPGRPDDAGEAGHMVRPVHIVLFSEEPLATYRGGVPGLAPTHPRARGEARLDPRAPESRAYLRWLERRQDDHLDAIGAALGRRPRMIFRYQAAGNGLALRLSPAEAARVARMPGVVRVIEDFNMPLDTDRGPVFIGADTIWDGSGTFGPSTFGEGVIVGIIDSGVNMGHPSFSDTPVDGHVFTNPFGSGNHVGWCDPGNPNYSPAFVCNDKLIGAWDFVDAVSVDSDGPEDSDSHGSHTASTAAGNRIDYDGDSIPDLSGVAPHANLITYDACFVDPGSGLGLCPFSATSSSVNQAILDGVDVINYSIGGGTFPWGGDIDTFFLDAVAAGIFVAASAGNSGPGASTLGHLGPWVTTVAASTHDLAQHENSLTGLSGGGTPPGDMNGQSRSGGYGPAPIVYAGNFSNGDANPEQCLSAFPPGTFSGQIVVCDRGGIARVMKGQHVLLGGAGGLVLANVAGGTTTLADDAHVLPAIHVIQADGDLLRTWLGSGSGHTATITASTEVLDPLAGDHIASFSSRGPNVSFDVLKPDVTNPGVNILAAVAAGFFDEPGLLPFGGLELFFLSGTSMSSPHTAGSGALLRSLHPTWTPTQIKSALITTAKTAGVVKEDGSTPSDPFDRGGGRVDLSRAGRAGLLFDETHANYLAADPGLGGDPRALNLPGLQEDVCPFSCSWTRTVTSPLSSSVTWNASGTGPAWMTLTVTPSNFTLAPGGSQTLTIEVTGAGGAPLNVWAFGEVTLTPDDSAVPDAHLPVAVRPTGLPTPVLVGHRVDDGLGNSDGLADPFERFALEVDVRNDGNGDATAVTATLSSTTPGVIILDASASIPDIPSGAAAVRTTDAPHFEVELDGTVPCGSLVDFVVDLDTNEGPFSLPFQMTVGLVDEPLELPLSSDTPLAIPDNDPAGVISTINVAESFVLENINVSVTITHPRRSNLEVDLLSPSGTVVRLHDRTGGGSSDIIATYDSGTAPDGPGSMADFDGENVLGAWTLTVVDQANNNVGTLNSWSLELDGVQVIACAAVPCRVVGVASATDGNPCEGDAITLSGAGSSQFGSDCSGLLEYRFSNSGGVLQDWSASDQLVTPATASDTYVVDIRDVGTASADTVNLPVTVRSAPVPAITQDPAPMCTETGVTTLDGGSGFVSYTWQNELGTLVGVTQALDVTTVACGQTHTVTVESVNGCSGADTHEVECLTCTPPEVSGPGDRVPFRMGLDAAGTVEFELLAETDVTYSLYQADTLAAALAGDWTIKYCDLENSITGTWTPVDAVTVRWTPLVPTAIFEGYWVVIVERFGFEGPYGFGSGGVPRPADLDGRGSAGSFGCP